ncbi:MAG: hypothetical protein V8Q76_04425 [Bacteroides intestinalis]
MGHRRDRLSEGAGGISIRKSRIACVVYAEYQIFRDKKVRILNGSHTGMVTLGLQLGCQTVMDAFNTPAIEKFVTTMVNEEVLPMIDEPMDDLKTFAAGILERFYNPYIKHMLASICLNSLSKWEVRNFPTVKDNFLKADKVAKYSLFSLASLFVLYSGKSEVDFKVEDTPEYIALIRENWDMNDINGTVEKICQKSNLGGRPDCSTSFDPNCCRIRKRHSF